jgi:hypothetical protein
MRRVPPGARSICVARRDLVGEGRKVGGRVSRCGGSGTATGRRGDRGHSLRMVPGEAERHESTTAWRAWEPRQSLQNTLRRSAYCSRAAIPQNQKSYLQERKGAISRNHSAPRTRRAWFARFETSDRKRALPPIVYDRRRSGGQNRKSAARFALYQQAGKYRAQLFATTIRPGPADLH